MRNGMSARTECWCHVLRFIIIILRSAVVKLSWFIKVRSYAKNTEELWLEEWHNPLSRNVTVGDPEQFMNSLEQPVGPGYK